MKPSLDGLGGSDAFRAVRIASDRSDGLSESPSRDKENPGLRLLARLIARSILEENLTEEPGSGSVEEG